MPASTGGPPASGHSAPCRCPTSTSTPTSNGSGSATGGVTGNVSVPSRDWRRNSPRYSDAVDGGAARPRRRAQAQVGDLVVSLPVHVPARRGPLAAQQQPELDGERRGRRSPPRSPAVVSAPAARINRSPGSKRTRKRAPLASVIQIGGVAAMSASAAAARPLAASNSSRPTQQRARARACIARSRLTFETPAGRAARRTPSGCRRFRSIPTPAPSGIPADDLPRVVAQERAGGEAQRHRLIVDRDQDRLVRGVDGRDPVAGQRLRVPRRRAQQLAAQAEVQPLHRPLSPRITFPSSVACGRIPT